MGATCTGLGSFLSPVPILCFPLVLPEDSQRLIQGLRPSCFLKDLVLEITPFLFFITCYSIVYLTEKVSFLDPHFPRSSAPILLLVFDTINHFPVFSVSGSSFLIYPELTIRQPSPELHRNCTLGPWAPPVAESLWVLTSSSGSPVAVLTAVDQCACLTMSSLGSPTNWMLQCSS